MARNSKQHKRKQPKNEDTENRERNENRKRGDASDSRGNHAYDRSGHNDPTWYTKIGPLAHDAAKLSFANAVGEPLRRIYSGPVNSATGKPMDADLINDGSTSSVAGIMALRVGICPGLAQAGSGKQAAVNKAAVDMYSAMRASNSRSNTYEPADLMVYIMALDSIFSCYAWGLRAYGSVALASAFNHYYPEGLLMAQGFDHNDWSRNLSKIRTRMNTAAAVMSSYKVPSNLSIIDRHFMLFSNIYMDDADVVKSQLYLYKPEGFYSFNKGDAGATLQYIPVEYVVNGALRPMTVDAYLDFLDTLVRNFTISADASNINGDLIKAFGDAQAYSLPMFADKYTTIPGYNEAVLYQMRNATLMGEPKQDTLNITQAGGVILFDPQFQIKTHEGEYSYVPRGNQLISAPHSSPSEEEVMVYTRLTQCGKPVVGTPYFKPTSLGCDYATMGEIWFWNSDLHEFGRKEFGRVLKNGNWQDGTIISDLSNFKHHPLVELWSLNDTTFLGEDFEYDDYGVASAEQLATCDNAALMSLFAVPTIDSWSRAK